LKPERPERSSCSNRVESLSPRRQLLWSSRRSKKRNDARFLRRRRLNARRDLKRSSVFSKKSARKGNARFSAKDWSRRSCLRSSGLKPKLVKNLRRPSARRSSDFKPKAFKSSQRSLRIQSSNHLRTKRRAFLSSRKEVLNRARAKFRSRMNLRIRVTILWRSSLKTFSKNSRLKAIKLSATGVFLIVKHLIRLLTQSRKEITLQARTHTTSRATTLW